MFQPGAARSALEKSLQDAARGVQAAHTASSARALDGYRDRLWLRPSRSSTRRGGAPYHRRHRESAASQQRAAGPDRTGHLHTRGRGLIYLFVSLRGPWARPDAARPGPAIEFFAGDGVIASLFSTAI